MEYFRCPTEPVTGVEESDIVAWESARKGMTHARISYWKALGFLGDIPNGSKSFDRTNPYDHI